MTVQWPTILSEQETMELVLAGRSMARFGDGELRLALGIGKHIAQAHDKHLSQELKNILHDQDRCLVCIPNHSAANGKPVMWGPTRYGGPEYRALYNYARVYGSAFVTRPDSAPWIDTDGYWASWCQLWDDREVTLVIGTRGGSLTHLPRARKVRLVYGPEKDAYAAVNSLMGAIGQPDHPVLICLGPTATVLAARLARLGVWALDLGHIGRFMPQRFLQA